MSDAAYGAADHVSPEELQELDEAFADVQPAATDEAPDGQYCVRVNEVKLARSSTGKPMIKWDLVILDGPHANRHIFKNAVIVPESLPYLKADLKLLGVLVHKLSDIELVMRKAPGVVLTVAKRTHGEYVNVYFNKRLEDYEGPRGDAAPTPF